MKPAQQREKLRKQFIVSAIAITSMEYRTESWNFRPKGDGRSGP